MSENILEKIFYHRCLFLKEWIVIGDVHGCVKTFETLINELKNKYSSYPIFTTGDLIDRGYESKKVFELIKKNNINSLLGNHEHMFLDFYFKLNGYENGFWLNQGGAQTLESFNISPTRLNYNDSIKEFVDYCLNLPLCYVINDDFLISHAGFSHGKINLNQKFSELYYDNMPIWFRKYENGEYSYLKYYRQYTQIVGHNQSPNIIPTKEDIKLMRFVNIDHGCVYSNIDYLGTLTAVICENNGKDISFISLPNMEDKKFKVIKTGW